MCSSAAPSWYLPLSASCSTKPTRGERRRIPCTVRLGQLELARELDDAEAAVASGQQA